MTDSQQRVARQGEISRLSRSRGLTFKQAAVTLAVVVLLGLLVNVVQIFVEWREMRADPRHHHQHLGRADLLFHDYSALFTLGQHGFSIEGHAEYIGKRSNEFGAPLSAWVLAQPQLRWDLGRALHGKPKRLFLGIEYQYWRNKLGDKNTSESRPQFLAVWRF